MQEQSVQRVAEQILSLRDAEVSDFIRSEVSMKQLSRKLSLLNNGMRNGNGDSRRMAREAIKRLGFL